MTGTIQGANRIVVIRRWLCCIALILPLSGAMSFASEQRPPNIIIILADDVGYGDLGGYFGGASPTPNIDRMAREGILFTDFHANGPMCSPTRASLLTGRYPQRLGVETPLREVLDLPHNRDEITIADLLRNKGYRTGLIGKWHVGAPGKGNPLHFGFDHFIGYHSGEIDHFAKLDRFGEEDWWHNETPVREEGYVTDLITKYSIEFIRQNAEKPFFLYISHLAIHFPWQKPTDHNLWIRSPGSDYTSNLPGPNSKLGPHPPEAVPGALSEMIKALDKSVGLVLETIRESHMEENTLIFFMSDNGGYIRYDNNTWPSVGSNGILNGQKGDVLEGGHRVPAIAWWPGKIPALSVTNQIVMTMDIFPTVRKLVGAPESMPRKGLPVDGVSIVPLLLEGEKLADRTLFWRIRNKKAVRSGEWKLVEEDKAIALYNLKHDVRESKDLKTRYPDIVQKLQNELQIWENGIIREKEQLK